LKIRVASCVSVRDFSPDLKAFCGSISVNLGIVIQPLASESDIFGIFAETLQANPASIGISSLYRLLQLTDWKASHLFVRDFSPNLKAFCGYISVRPGKLF
jgi:hypothetical protein